MHERTNFADLHNYHRWATRKLLRLCQGLPDAQLDREEPIGLGSLRATLHHVWGAEFLWLSRWKGVSPTSFPTEKDVPIAELERRFAAVDEEREALLRDETEDFSRVVHYKNLAGEAFSAPLSSLMLHVVNHGVHHRAQALHYLKLVGVTVPGGLDYIFYRLAVPTVDSPQTSREKFRSYGLDMGDEPEGAIAHSPELIALYAAYGDWGMKRLFDHAEGMLDADLDRDFNMGMGTLRKTLLHLYDAEIWWHHNWRGEKTPFQRLPTDTPIADLRDRWMKMAADRSDLIGRADGESLKQVVEGDFGSGVFRLRVGETLIQLGVHGTHHRAQAINMLRRLGVESKPFDLAVWIRER